MARIPAKFAKAIDIDADEVEEKLRKLPRLIADAGYEVADLLREYKTAKVERDRLYNELFSGSEEVADGGKPFLEQLAEQLGKKPTEAQAKAGCAAHPDVIEAEHAVIEAEVEKWRAEARVSSLSGQKAALMILGALLRREREAALLGDDGVGDDDD